MKLNFSIQSFGKVSFLTIALCSLLNCSPEKSLEQTVIIVKVPPLYDNNLTREENYWRFQKFLYPQREIPNPIPKRSPPDASVLFVSIDDKGDIKLNFEAAGNISKTDSLTSRLAYIFSEREWNGMYEPGTRKIVKNVRIKTDDSIKYGDFIKVVEAVKQSGAEPIVLVFNEDTKPKPNIDL